MSLSENHTLVWYDTFHIKIFIGVAVTLEIDRKNNNLSMTMGKVIEKYSIC